MAFQKPLFHDLSFAELENKLLLIGEPSFRARQIWVALYQNNVTDVMGISTLPLGLRESLSDQYCFSPLTPAKQISTKDGQTQKTLFKLQDGALIEAVLMMYDERRTVCISSQSGCGLDCAFCATGQMGLTRNLTVGEIVAQVQYFSQHLISIGERVTNVVMMGMGEPFLNYENVMRAVERIIDPDGMRMGARRITISTVGIVPRIKKFADAGTQVNLAISLHTVDDALRTRLMPINNKYPVKSVLEACRYYIKNTNRRVTFEYALIRDVNDSVKEAEALAQNIKDMNCHVNLIRLNPTPGFNKPSAHIDNVVAFCDVLERYQIPCTVRLGRGIDIAAGCGQLAVENNK